MSIKDNIRTVLQAAFDMPDYTPDSEEDAERVAPSGWNTKLAKSRGTEDGLPSNRPITGYDAVDTFTSALQAAGATWAIGSITPFTKNDGSKLIGLPNLELFNSSVTLAYTLAHEGSHWVGAYGKHRAAFHERPYPVEEVIAETTGRLLMDDWGLSNERTRSTAQGYISNWLSASPNRLDPYLAALFGMEVDTRSTRHKYTVEQLAKLVEQRYKDVQAIIKGV